MARVLFGVSGWDYKDWCGPLYPQPKPKDYRGLELIARFLDFMEVNVTFYRPMIRQFAERWLDQTPESFGFLVKAYRGWTHEGHSPVGEDIEMFRDLLAPMLEQGRLLGVLAQYPPSAHDGNWLRTRLCALRDAVAPARMFVEVRDRSLYQVEFLEFLQAEQLRFVNVDLPDVRSLPTLSRINTGPEAFLRLHGRNVDGWRLSKGRDHRYDYKYGVSELEELMETVDALAQRVATVLVAGNNHFRAQAPAAMVVMKSLSEKRRVPAPQRLLEAYPELEDYAIGF